MCPRRGFGILLTMKFHKFVVLFVMTVWSVQAFGSGFALYQPSVISHAMGGALVGRAMDASANFNNPATLTDLTNIWVTLGFVTEHPRGSVRGRTNFASWGEDQTMDPGFFSLPHFQLAIPLPADFVFGFGATADYGLGTHYADTWRMNWNVRETTVQGFVLTPNLAYKLTDKWSVGAGLRWLFFDFEQYSDPYVVQSGVNYGRFQNRLKGDNDWKSLGWQIGTKYDVTDTFSVGLVYKSAIDVTVKGKTANVPVAYNYSIVPSYLMALSPAMYYTKRAELMQMVNAAARSRTGSAEADLTLPQSLTAGCNWDVTESWHLGAALSWTQWSQFDVLHFDLQGGDKDTRLNWRDTWRGSIGSCWDFAEDWKWMISYVYDMDCTDVHQESAMLPPADRHIAATGFVWNCWANLDLALSYSCIFMDGRGMDTTDPMGNWYHLETCRGFCHAVGFNVTYRF